MIVRIAPAAQPERGTSLWLWCPGCDELHRVQFGGTASEAVGPQWDWDGDRDRPTISPSILVRYGVIAGVDKRCHSFVRDGQWQFLGDCTHELAGQTVPCVPIPDGLFSEDASA